MLGPCAWTADWSCCEVPADSEAITGSMLQGATELLWALSGRQFGECTVTLRPCREDCWDGRFRWSPWGGSYPFPAKIDGIWVNFACGSCPGSCSCSRVSKFMLPTSATEIVQIKIDGDILDPDAYRLDNRIKVVRQDGGEWPRCNSESKIAGEDGTWTVTTKFGRELPKLGELAVAELTCEYIKFCTNADDCQLPANWASINQSGLTITRANASKTDLDDLPEEWLPWTRRFLRAFNPNRLVAPSQVWSPDVPTPIRTF